MITDAVRLAFAGGAWPKASEATVRPAIFQAGLRRGLTIIKILLIVAIIAAVYCIFAAIICLVAASREIELPDIEDIEIVE